ncbi:MAG: GntR family transcriptional regulator [Pseudomonadota bacterium]
MSLNESFTGAASRVTVAAVHQRLRAAIFDAELRPGDQLSTVQLAKRFGVSRTPLREALRMLQEEGLVQAQSNRRARVAEFDADDLELVYSSRLMLSSLATTMTVPRMSQADVDELRNLHAEMREAAAAGDVDGWQALDRRFHLAHAVHVPATLRRELEALYARAALYRRMWMRDRPYQLPSTDAEHEAIIQACASGDARAAVGHIARHLSKIAFSLLADTTPEREPTMVRTALQVLLNQSAPAPHNTARRDC